MAKPKKAASETPAAGEKQKPANKTKAETPKAEEKASKAKAEEVKKTGTHEAVQEFRDYAESTDGSGYALYKKGDDVSHLPESKLKTFVEAGLVKQSAPKQ
jgi:hypothetical protein